MVRTSTDDSTAESDRVTIRELQRHTSEVLDRVQAHGPVYVTRHGRVVARILPPDPAEEQINAAIAAGILDPRALTEPYTVGQMLEEFPRSSRDTGPSLTDTVIAFRKTEGDR